MLSLRKNHITALLQILFVLCTLVSCIDDDLVAGRGDASDEEMYYLGIKLKFDTNSSPFTRAEGDKLDPGTKEEQDIALTAKNFVILFKKNSKNVDELLGIFDFWDTEQNPDIGDDEQGKYPPKAEAKYTYVARIPVQDVKKWTGSALVVLNGKDKIYDTLKKKFKDRTIDVTSTNAATLDEVLTEVWAEQDLKEHEDPRDIGYADKNHRFFTMSNSVYYEVDENNKPTKLHVAKEFDAEKYVKKTYAQAKRDPITVYVERMVAKFSFDLLNDKRIFQPSKKADMIVFDGFSNGSPKYKMKKWQIEVTGWNVNALETKSYIFKKLQSPEYFKKWEPEFKWNDDSNFRSYWCEDPHYDYQYEDESENKKDPNTPWEYSWQYRRSVDFGLQYYDEEEENPEKLPLRNYSFEELNLGKPNKKPDGSEFKDSEELKEYIDNDIKTKIVYTPENTYDPEVVAGTNGKKHDSRDELLAGTHLLVGAEFQIQRESNESKDYYIDAKDDDTSENYRVPQHLFRDRNGFHFLSERECVASLVHDFNQLLESQSTMVFTHYDWGVNGSSSETLIADTEGKYKLYYKDNTDVWKELKETDILNKEIFSDEELAMPIAATVRKGDGKRLPWIEQLIEHEWLAIGTDEQHLSVEIYTAVKSEEAFGAYVPDKKKGDTQSDISFIKSLLYEWLGAIDHFNEGKMYYSIPVKQANYINEGNKKTDIYGVVRNNWYKFTLEDVKALGTSIDKADQPIVPERVGLNDEINFTIKILGWHTVEENIPSI